MDLVHAVATRREYDGTASTARSHSPVGSRVDAQGSDRRGIRLGVVDGKKGNLRSEGGSLGLLGEEPRRFGVTVEDGRDETNHVRDIGRGVNGTAEMDNSRRRERKGNDLYSGVRVRRDAAKRATERFPGVDAPSKSD